MHLHLVSSLEKKNLQVVAEMDHWANRIVVKYVTQAEPFHFSA